MINLLDHVEYGVKHLVKPLSSDHTGTGGSSGPTEVMILSTLAVFCPSGIFAPVSKISKVVDQTPSSVTSTPRTPRMDLASRLAGKTKKEKEKKEKEKEREKGNGCSLDSWNVNKCHISNILMDSLQSGTEHLRIKVNVSGVVCFYQCYRDV